MKKIHETEKEKPKKSEFYNDLKTKRYFKEIKFKNQLKGF